MVRIQWQRLAVAALGVFMLCEQSGAQTYNNGPTTLSQITRRDIGSGYSVGSINTNSLRSNQGFMPNPTGRSGGGSLGLSSGPVSKPFSTYSPAPTVSPYLNLFREDFDGSEDFNYNTLVRPMLQQQAFNEQVQRQSIETGKRLQALAAKADYNPQGSESQYPTGHKTVFGYTGHFYPQTRQQR